MRAVNALNETERKRKNEGRKKEIEKSRKG